ncbi:MAG: hypothetical protein R3B70_14840 [Polyangiaceae bacterium]
MGALVPASCDAIVGAGDRELDASIVCDDDGGCTCAEGRGDCDGDADNGCETDLSDADNCGACGVTCANGGCESFTCACEAGFGECDGDPTTVCETDLQTDGAHCGACSRDCLGGACEDGLCAPQLVPNSPAYAFTVHGDQLYFTHLTQGGLFRVSTKGGLAEKISDSDALGLIVRVVGDIAYWSAVDSVLATPTDGSPTMVLANGVQPLYQLWVAGGQVYWDNPDPTMAGFSALVRTSTLGGAPVEKVALLGETKYLADFATSETHVYWDDVTLIHRAPHDDTTITDFLNAPTSPTFFATDDANLYFAGGQSGTYAVPLTGGAANEIADAAPGYGSLVSDGQNVFFITFADGDSTKAIWRVPRDGSAPPVKLAEDPDGFSGQPMSVDDKYVYWLNESAVARVPK